MSLTLKALVISLITLANMGCSPVLAGRVLPLPGKPALPAIAAQEVSCLSDATWQKLVKRDVLQRHYIEDLQLIIKSTQEP